MLFIGSRWRGNRRGGRSSHSATSHDLMPFAAHARLLHRAVLGMDVGVVGKYLLDDLGLELAVVTLGHLDEVEILDRIVIGVEPEVPAQGWETGFHHSGAQRILVRGVAL